MGKRGQDQAKPPMKEPPMTRYRDKLGASEKHRTKLDTKDKSNEVAHEQKGDEASRGSHLNVDLQLPALPANALVLMRLGFAGTIVYWLSVDADPVSSGEASMYIYLPIGRAYK
ncbi:hypothetical protein T492DRAFT_1146094 [Pavlovales sp. CCMP2436]|nr:hypothetical protein T492DRAFT_1146094 [Pavlovales sp. CCMP2436]